MNPKGEIMRYKARLVVKGFLQKPGVDYGEAFSPVARIETVLVVVALAVFFSWSMHQLNVNAAFLNGFLEEDVYVRQLVGFIVKGGEEKVYKLKKALYDLKQAPRAWNQRIDQFLRLTGFSRCNLEHGVYMRSQSGDSVSNKLIVLLYVDYLLVTGGNDEDITHFKQQMLDEFEMSDIGELKYFLGIEFTNIKHGIIMHQTKYTQDLLK